MPIRTQAFFIIENEFPFMLITTTVIRMYSLYVGVCVFSPFIALCHTKGLYVCLFNVL